MENGANYGQSGKAIERSPLPSTQQCVRTSPPAVGREARGIPRTHSADKEQLAERTPRSASGPASSNDASSGVVHRRAAANLATAGIIFGRVGGGAGNNDVVLGAYVKRELDADFHVSQ